jgi:hypothetical protein
MNEVKVDVIKFFAAVALLLCGLVGIAAVFVGIVQAAKVFGLIGGFVAAFTAALAVAAYTTAFFTLLEYEKQLTKWLLDKFPEA